MKRVKRVHYAIYSIPFYFFLKNIIKVFLGFSFAFHFELWSCSEMTEIYIVYENRKYDWSLQSMYFIIFIVNWYLSIAFNCIFIFPCLWMWTVMSNEWKWIQYQRISIDFNWRQALWHTFILKYRNRCDAMLWFCLLREDTHTVTLKRVGKILYKINIVILVYIFSMHIILLTIFDLNISNEQLQQSFFCIIKSMPKKNLKLCQTHTYTYTQCYC